MKRVDLKDLEKGDSVLEFAVVIPVFIMILGVTGILAWIFWAQGAAGMLSAQVARRGGLNQGETVAPLSGLELFQGGVSGILGGQTGSLIGSPGVTANASQRQVNADLSDTFGVRFGLLGFTVEFSGGGASRMHLFYAGPPDPWE